MTAKKTQCPFCESVFAVTPEQLSARGGHVRCGKCFQVFKADEHLLLPSALGGTVAQSSTATADIFDLLDQPSRHHDESDTLAGQPILAAQPETIGQPLSQAHDAKPSDLGKLEQKADLEMDFDALFAGLAPQSIDPNNSYAQSAQSKNDDFTARPAPPSEDTEYHATAVPQKTSIAQVKPDNTSLDLPALDQVKHAAQIQDTPPPGSVAAVVLPPIVAASNPTKVGTSVFNKKQQTSAKVSVLKLDDELSELFLGDSGNPAKKDLLAQNSVVGVDKLSSTADESWADALLQEEETSKKAEAERQAEALLGSKRPPSVLKPSSAKLSTTTAAKPSQPMFDQSTHRAVALEEDDLLSYLNQVGAASEKTDDTGSARANKKTTTKGLPPPASHRVKVPVKPQQSSGRYLVWSVLCGLLLLLLAAQWLYFNFSDLAADPRHNSRLTALCVVIGCQVPAMDLSQISTSRIKLQRSPDARNSTQVSLNLTNQANNSQLMPKLKFLQLNDGKVSAYRLVEPHEYLQGNNRRLKQMLPRQSLPAEFHLNIKRSELKKYDIELVY